MSEDHRVIESPSEGLPMLSPEDRSVLECQARRPSSVSQILRKIVADFDGPTGKWDIFATDEDQSQEYEIRVAHDRESRQCAYMLAHRTYRSCGYSSDDWRSVISQYDSDPATFTLLAQDQNGQAAGTATLVFDSEASLPCDEIYAGELNVLRAQGRRMAEVTRLAIADSHRQSRNLLVRIFNFIYVFSHIVKGFDDLVVEVNPRHTAFYQRLLSFRCIGPERPCPRVNGAPAVLLRIDMHETEAILRRLRTHGHTGHDRSLYPQFYSYVEEGAIAELMAKSHKPMSHGDLSYFGLPHSRTLAAVS